MKERGILLDRVTGDLLVRGGKMEIGDVTEQNEAVIIRMHAGEVKDDPTMGVGISDMILGSDTAAFEQRIRENLGSDGLKVNNLELVIIDDNVNIEIDARY